MPREGERGTGDYRLRLAILPRVLGAQGANGENGETWPDPPAGGNQFYFAKREEISGSELIALGMRSSTESLRVRIRGRTIAVKDADRVKNTVTGEVYNVIGMYRDYAETVLTLDRQRQQATGQ